LVDDLGRHGLFRYRAEALAAKAIVSGSE